MHRASGRKPSKPLCTALKAPLNGAFLCLSVPRWQFAIIFNNATTVSACPSNTLDDDPSMKKILALTAVLAIAGCTTASDTLLKNGEQGLTIDCSGEANSWASCYEKADASCAGTGYRIVGTNGTPALKESDKTLGQDVGNFKGRSVVVVCK